jgi:hypothetical protein
MIARSKLKDSDYSDDGRTGHKTRKASNDLKARLWICKEVVE